MRRILPLLALLPLPLAAADDLGWHVQVASCSKYAAVEFQAQLRNVTNGKIAFKGEGDRPAAELILESAGKAPVRKPLPRDAVAYRGPDELAPGQYGWYVSCDLRLAFGRLAPGRYTLRAVFGDIASEPAAFEVSDTSVEEAKKNWAAPEGIEFRVADKDGGKVGILVNRRKTPLALLAYAGAQGAPLQALVTAQQWTGRAWTGFVGGFCGTGLEEVTIAPGAEREIALPSFPDGILRLAVSCHERAGEETKAIEAVTEPFLVDTFKG